jgi:hypothetical protein
VKVVSGTLAGFTPIKPFLKNIFNEKSVEFPIIARPATCEPLCPYAVFLQKGSGATGR